MVTFSAIEQYIYTDKQGSYTDVYALGATLYTMMTSRKLDTALIISNAAWIHYENQFVDTLKVEQEVDTESAPAYVNATGEMTINGESETNGN